MTTRKVTLVNLSKGKLQCPSKGKQIAPFFHSNIIQSPNIKSPIEFENDSNNGLSIHVESEYSKDPNMFFKFIYRDWVNLEDTIYIEMDQSINVLFKDILKNNLTSGDHIIYIAELNSALKPITIHNIKTCEDPNLPCNQIKDNEDISLSGEDTWTQVMDHPIQFVDPNIPGYGVDPKTKIRYLKFHVGEDLVVKSLDLEFKSPTGCNSKWALVVQNWNGEYGASIPIKVMRRLGNMAVLNIIKSIGEHHDKVNNELAELASAHGDAATNPLSHLDNVTRKLYAVNIQTAEGRQQLFDQINFEKRRFYKISKRIRAQYHQTLEFITYLEECAHKI